MVKKRYKFKFPEKYTRWLFCCTTHLKTSRSVSESAKGGRKRRRRKKHTNEENHAEEKELAEDKYIINLNLIYIHAYCRRNLEEIIEIK